MPGQPSSSVFVRFLALSPTAMIDLSRMRRPTMAWWGVRRAGSEGKVKDLTCASSAILNEVAR